MNKICIFLMHLQLYEFFSCPDISDITLFYVLSFNNSHNFRKRCDSYLTPREKNSQIRHEKFEVYAKIYKYVKKFEKFSVCSWKFHFK